MAADVAVVTARAFAKINLTLRVLGVRPDGFHELRTTFQSLALHDTLTLEPRPGPLEIACDSPDCPADRTNLVWRAAQQVWREAGRRGEPAGVRVVIDKRIPASAGLGGGSSDAAAALRAFAALWRVPMPADGWTTLAAALGADVPYFLEGGTALGIERGDVLFPLKDLPPASVVVVVPGFGVSTRDAYGWWDADAGARSAPRRRTRWGSISCVEGLPPGELVNDLEGPVSSRHAQIGRLVTALRRAGATYAAMSGSGSAVFGLFPTGAAARAAGAVLGRSGRVLVTRTVDRPAYRRLAKMRTIV